MVQHQVPLLDPDQRLQRCAFIGSQPDLSEDERAPVKLDQGRTSRLGLGDPGEPLGISV